MPETLRPIDPTQPQNMALQSTCLVRDRIRRYYNRDADIVHPYVDDAFLDAPLIDALRKKIVALPAEKLRYPNRRIGIIGWLAAGGVFLLFRRPVLPTRVPPVLVLDILPYRR